MRTSFRSFFTATAVLSFAALVGCAAPCDRYCSQSAEYIDFCLTNGSQAEWQSAGIAGGDGWGNWGVGNKDEYVGDCQTDFDSQLSGVEGEDRDGLEGLCEDDANRYAQLVERGQCTDLP